MQRVHGASKHVRAPLDVVRFVRVVDQQHDRAGLRRDPITSGDDETHIALGILVGPGPPGDTRSEGWGLYIDRHPELAIQAFSIFTVVDVDCSQKKVAYVRADASTCLVAPPPRLTAAQIQAFRDYRRGRQATAKTWMDTAGADHLTPGTRLGRQRLWGAAFRPRRARRA
jgi:hypothetical protein